jgi:hypothetical protein
LSKEDEGVNPGEPGPETDLAVMLSSLSTLRRSVRSFPGFTGVEFPLFLMFPNKFKGFFDPIYKSIYRMEIQR